MPDSSTCLLAVDPGLSGALAFLYPATPDRVALEDMPVVAGEVGVAALRLFPACAASFSRKKDHHRADAALIAAFAAATING